MSCIKYTLTNTGTTIINFNYQKCADNLWIYQVELEPNQTKNIWVQNQTLQIPQYFLQTLEIVNDGEFPEPPITPTPTPTHSQTPTITPTETTTPTPTPTPTPESLINPLVIGLDEYLIVGQDQYLQYTNP